MNSIELELMGINPQLGKQLTDRQYEIVKLLCQGKSRFEMAEILDISPHTVKNLIVAITDKTGLESSLQIALWHIDNALLERHDIHLKSLLD